MALGRKGHCRRGKCLCLSQQARAWWAGVTRGAGEGSSFCRGTECLPACFGALPLQPVPVFHTARPASAKIPSCADSWPTGPRQPQRQAPSLASVATALSWPVLPLPSPAPPSRPVGPPCSQPAPAAPPLPTQPPLAPGPFAEHGPCTRRLGASSLPSQGSQPHTDHRDTPCAWPRATGMRGVTLLLPFSLASGALRFMADTATAGSECS